MALSGALSRLKQLRRYLAYRRYHAALPVRDFAGKDVVLFYMYPHNDIRSGGVLSIYFLLECTREILSGAVVLPATLRRLPGYTRVGWFENGEDIYNIGLLRKALDGARRILVHVPEAMFAEFSSDVRHYGLEDLAARMDINILNQNNDLMPAPEVMTAAKPLFRSLNMTLGFKANTDNVYPALDTAPMFISNWFYRYSVEEIPFEKKDAVCVISHDPHPRKAAMMQRLEAECGLECIEVRNMAFHDFQALQRRAKWSVSFGEGYDNYFAGPFLKGGVGFGVYNADFFPKEYRADELPESVFTSYDDLERRLVDTMKRMDNKAVYEAYSARIKALVLADHSPEIVRGLLTEFYTRIGYAGA